MAYPENTRYGSSSSGFTLIEMVIALAITGIIGIAIMNLYINSSRTYDAQTQVAEAQQNARAAIETIVFDLRNAGYNPTASTIAGLGFVQAGANVLQITMDLSDDTGADGYQDVNGDGIPDPRAPDGDILLGGVGNPDPNENVIYSRYNAGVNDAYGNPIRRLGRSTNLGVTNIPVAEYIEQIGFAYAFDSDADGQLDVDGAGQIHWAVQAPGGGNWFELDTDGDDQITVADGPAGGGIIGGIDTGIVANFADIRAVKIWVLARAPRIDRSYATTPSYVVGNLVTPPNNDNFRRRLLSTVVTCRNMGL